MAEPWVEKREIGPCTLYLADSVAFLDDGFVPFGATIVTDPPYGQGYKHGTAAASGWAKVQNIGSRTGAASQIIGDDRPFDPAPWLAHAELGNRRRSNAAAKQGGAARIALLGAEHYAARLPEYGAWYCWDKSCGGGPADSFTDAEFAWMSARNARRVYRHQWKGRLRGGSNEPRWHVSEKPVGLMAWMIETVRTPVDSLVCDPYMGSGTTGIACLRTGRRFLGIEIDPGHFAVACERIARAWAAQA